MTEQEAKYEIIEHKPIIGFPKYVKALNIAINALEEVQQYRAIGTPEECKEAVEVKKEITEIVNRQLIAGKDNYKEIYNCFYEIVKIIQDNY